MSDIISAAFIKLHLKPVSEVFIKYMNLLIFIFKYFPAEHIDEFISLVVKRLHLTQ